MKSRRHFLKEVCPTVAFAFFGLSFLEACSSGDDDVATTNPNNGAGTNAQELELITAGSIVMIVVHH